jgi:putative ABC transport system permease protein
MFLYNLKVAFRNLSRQKSNALINILGLTLGTSCTILLFLIVYFSYSTDTYHDNYEKIFLLQQKIKVASGEYTADRAGGAVAPALAEAYPQIESYTRIGNLGEMLLAYYPDGKNGTTMPISFVEKNGAAVDSTFFDVFSFDLLSGYPPKGIYKENFIYLTEKVAHKLFNRQDPVGETVYFQEGLALTVNGVVKDLPENSTVKFTYLVPFKVQAMIGLPTDSYGGTMYYNYFVLNSPQSAEVINADINEFLEPKYEEALEVDRFLTHIRDAFLYGENKAFWGILIFGIAGLGILFVAGINYVNLATARSMDRAKEVGIRKTGGADRWQLIKQFISESTLITFISVGFSVVATEIALPFFNRLFEAQLAIPYNSISFWIFILLLVIGIGFLAGMYPAFMLSSVRPSLILKNFQGGRSKGATLRRILVVSQFSITLFFIVCSVFLFKQISYLDTADLGVEKDNIIYIPTRGKLWNIFDELKAELLKEANIISVTSASEIPTNVDHGEIDWGKEKGQQNAIARILWCSEDAPETFGIELVHGRFYDELRSSDREDGIIVNEEILKMLQYKGDPIGQRFRLWENEKTIIGVVKNFTFFPIDIGAKALIMPYRNINQYIFIKTTSGYNAANIARLKKTIKKYNPDYPFEYYALSDYKNPTVVTSQKLIPVLFFFSVFGITISCLGIFGLALFTLEKRTKEIGIRKVFGASTQKIIMLISRNFVALVLLANVIALPLSYLALRGILTLFAVKIALSPGIFLSVGLSIVLMAWLIVLWQALKVTRKILPLH